MAAKKGKKRRSAKKAPRVASACKAKRAAIGKQKNPVARGRALHAYMVCQAAHNIKPRKARRRGRK